MFHLVTAARGAEKFYTLENNAARSEPIEVARVLDDRVLRAWLGHPKLHVFDNSVGFSEKIQAVRSGAFVRPAHGVVQLSHMLSLARTHARRYKTR